MATPRVFISMGTPYTAEYAQFRDALEAFLRDRCNADPRIIGKNEYPSGNPLNKIRDVMSSCHGVLVVAYERKFLKEGSEKRGSDASKHLEKRIYTTPWNHVESAMAFSLGLPIYIICQHGLAEEGLIESKLDWYVLHTDISAQAFAKPEVAESIRHWINAPVAARAKRPRIGHLVEGTIKLTEMTPKEIFVMMAGLSAAFFLGAGAATLFPKLFH